MFKKNQQQKKIDISQQEISTIIGEGYVFTGELTGASVIRIEGTIVGNVCVEGGVVLGVKGKIEGDIKTNSAIIYGVVEGNVHAGQLEIKKTGRIEGDITTDNVEIELGARYNGRLQMTGASTARDTSSQAKVIDVAG